MVAIVAVIAIDVIGTETAKEIVTVMTETVTDVIVTATEIGTATAIAMEEAGRISLASDIMKVMAMTTLAPKEGIERFKCHCPIYQYGRLWWVSLKVLPYPFFSSVASHG